MLRQSFIFLFCWLVFMICATAQQTSINGIVAIHNSKYETGKTQYVPNAQVEEDFERSQPTTSDANGQFKLYLIGIPDGERFSYAVRKMGLEVVNFDELEAVAGQRETVKVYMAKPQYVADFRKNIYRVGKTTAEKSLERKLTQLQNEYLALKESADASLERLAAYEAEIATLSQEFDNIEKQARDLAEKYARINLDDASDLYREAFRHFQAGDLEQALQVLQNAKLREQAQNILSERERIANLRREAEERDSIQSLRTGETMQALRLKADMHKARYEWDSAYVAYDLLIQLDSTNLDNLWEVAVFMQMQRYDSLAYHYYQQCLRYAETDVQKGAFLNNLGWLVSGNQRMTGAEGYYAEALTIYRQLASKNPDAFLPKVAMTLNNSGVFYRATRRMAEAEAHYTEAVNIYRELADKNPDAFLSLLANILDNLGVFYEKNNRMTAAEVHYKEALNIYRQLADENSDALLLGLTKVLNNLGVYYETNKRIAEAEAHYQEALDIRRQLADKNPGVFLPHLANILNNLGILYKTNQQVTAAEAHYQEALDIYRQLADKNPMTYLPPLATTLNDLGQFYADQRKVEAETYYNEAVNIYRQLADRYPDAFNLDVCTIAFNICVFYKKTSADSSDDVYHRKALELLDEVAERLSDFPRYIPIVQQYWGLHGYYKNYFEEK